MVPFHQSILIDWIDIDYFIIYLFLFNFRLFSGSPKRRNIHCRKDSFGAVQSVRFSSL